MGFNKRFLNKEYILNNINSIREIISTDALITDNWSHKFIINLNPKEADIRDLLNEVFKFDSGINYRKNPLYFDLTSLSECLISLKTNPSWLDIQVAIDRLEIEIKPEESGRFQIMVDKCINSIIDFFDKNNL